MNEYIFSPGKNAFYPLSLQSEYEAAGTWPDDGVPVDSDVYIQFTGQPPVGKVRGVVDDMPSWVDVPPPSHDELVTIAEQQKKTLLDAANNKIAPLQDAAELDMATDDEAASLLAWKKYRVLVNRVNPDEAPDIEWPAAPQ